MSLNKQLKKIIIIFSIGILFIFCGFLFGEFVAAIISFNTQYVYENTINAFTYTPIIIGVYLLIISLILFKEYKK